MICHLRSRVVLVAAVMVVGSGLLIESTGAQEAPRLVDFRGVRSRLNPHHWPILGPPDAPVVLIELFDYTCVSCQQMRDRITAAQQRYGNDLAVIVVPVVLEGRKQRQSEQLAQLALSVFVADRTKFAGFHKWLLTGQTPNRARREATRLVGAARLNKALASNPVKRYLQLSGTLYNNANRGKLPLLASDKFATRGAMQRNQELFNVIERYHKVQSVLDNRMAGS